MDSWFMGRNEVTPGPDGVMGMEFGAYQPKHPITAYNGSYTYSIPIEVPAFRGIEPKLKLSYDSARGVRNAPSTGSWLGVGWKLDGLSAIERVSGSWKPLVDFSKQSDQPLMKHVIVDVAPMQAASRPR